MKNLPTLLMFSLLFVGCQNNSTSETGELTIGQQTDTLPQDIVAEDSFVITLATDPNILLEQIHNNTVDFDFYASFTEPFWTLYFIDNDVVFNSAEDGPEIFELYNRFDPTKKQQLLTFSKDGEDWDVQITKGSGSDGMSEINYPYAVVLNENFHGGGGEEYAKESPE